jgi:hypothetical protein
MLETPIQTIGGTSLDKTSSSKSSLPVQAIVLAETTWAILALLVFLVFSNQLPGETERPFLYSLGTSILEAIAYLAAAILCFRNWRSSQIVSGRSVWLGIGLGMACYFIGNLLFSYWELVLGRDAAVSLGDFFFIPAYLFLIWGMILAVTSRRLNLEIWQWGVVGLIALVGILLAVFISTSPVKPQSLLIQPVVAQTTPAASPLTSVAQANPQLSPTTPATSSSPGVSPTGTAAPNSQMEIPAIEEKSPPPEWVESLEQQLESLETPINWFYVVCDVVLLIIATTLLLAFWGGRFAQSWRMIAFAALSLYIADIWFKYATNRIDGYQSGAFLEVFWVISGVLFGIGAALEYDLSSRSRSRSSGRRRTSS